MAFQRNTPVAIGVKAAFPGFIEPALATAIEKVPTGTRWIHEGHDWTRRFKIVADAAFHVSAGSAILDGEIVVPAVDGTTDFSVLQSELKGKSTRIVMVAFDLLYLDGYDLRMLPLTKRKAQLKKLIARTDIQYSESFEGDGREIHAHACKIGLEGVVSKVADSRYVSGRGNDWVKKTCAQRETLTIAGFALDGNDWDGIYLARRQGNDLVYAGKVDHARQDLRRRTAPAPDAVDPQDATLHEENRA